MKKLYYVFVFLILLVLFVTGTDSCNDKRRQRSDQKLANSYCGSCHKLPNPASLTKDVWRDNIMSRMSDYYNWTEVSRFKYANKKIFEDRGAIPMSDTIWAALQHYFVSGGLDEPIVRAYDALPIQTHFQIQQVDNICSGRGITAVAIDENNDNIIAACNSQLLTINQEGLLSKVSNSGGLVSGIFPKDTSSAYILDPGILDPHNEALGSMNGWNQQTDNIETIYKGLQRPVYLSQSDNDIFISEFGDETGGLGQLQFDSKKYLNASKLPGAYKSFIYDYDKDGTDEVIVMFAQAMEGIYVREVEAVDQTFVPLLSFLPEWGISDVDTTDVNLDGWTDLVIVNGDNADFSLIPKAYHGVRVYLNNQNGGYEESFSFPMHGASQVRALDANNDGFDDLLVGAYFAIDDRDRLMILLHNADPNNLAYAPHRIAEASLGRWMVINKGDVDGDGDLDAIIGSFVISKKSASINDKEVGDQTDLLILLNKSK